MKKNSPGCNCCGTCDKIVPYVSPFVESGDFSARFSNWNLSGLNQFNTYTTGGFPGWVRVVAIREETGPGFPSPPDTYIYSVKLYKHPTITTNANLVASWSTTASIPSVIIGQTINFTEENGSGVSGSVDYDVPLTTSFSSYVFSVRGTNTECDLTVNATGVSTVTWQVTAIDDPFTVFNPGTGGIVTISNTADIIRSIAVALNADTTGCLAEGTYATPSPGGPFPLHAVYDGFPALEEDTGYGLFFNDFTGSSYGKFALVIDLATSSSGRNDVVAFQVAGDAYDICLEIPPTTITNSYGDEITIRMDHS